MSLRLRQPLKTSETVTEEVKTLLVGPWPDIGTGLATASPAPAAAAASVRYANACSIDRCMCACRVFYQTNQQQHPHHSTPTTAPSPRTPAAAQPKPPSSSSASASSGVDKKLEELTELERTDPLKCVGGVVVLERGLVVEGWGPSSEMNRVDAS